MSKLLLDEHPLMVMPRLASKIGLNESIFLQQVHYWNEINKKSNNNYKDGHYWTFNSVAGWSEQFPFWSKNTIQRTITNLENMKLLVTGNYNKLKIDRTKWYRIDHDVLQALEESPFTQIGVTNIPKWVEHLSTLGLPLPEINSKIKAKTTPKRYLITETANEGYVFSYYNFKFNEKFKKNHPTITGNQLVDLECRFGEIRNELNLSDGTLIECIDSHFDNLADSNDGKIFSFIGESYATTPILRYADIS
ncbi:replication protein [Sporosarcina sp. FSL K6-3457]|uniref:replication protein n=1 Tax=Sporosarcina sp. FSL K6-3457 TaxID=2978204 RepID=UPI0030F8C8DA